MNWEFVTRYLFHNLPGSCTRRKNHSKPFLCIQPGALFCSPTNTGRAAPTPTSVALILNLIADIHFSCFGHPKTTNTKCAPDSFIMSTISLSSLLVKALKGGLYK